MPCGTAGSCFDQIDCGRYAGSCRSMNDRWRRRRISPVRFASAKGCQPYWFRERLTRCLIRFRITKQCCGLTLPACRSDTFVTVSPSINDSAGRSCRSGSYVTFFYPRQAVGVARRRSPAVIRNRICWSGKVACSVSRFCLQVAR
jgi:hypothetical protein